MFYPRSPVKLANVRSAVSFANEYLNFEIGGVNDIYEFVLAPQPLNLILVIHVNSSSLRIDMQKLESEKQWLHSNV